MQIYVHKNNQQLGPFTEAEIRAQLAAGAISLQDHVWWQGQANWLPLSQTSLVAPSAPGVPLISAPTSMPYGAVPMGAMRGGTSQLAIWSLVCGCLGLLCGLFAAIPAIVLGHMSLSEIRKNPSLEGRGMALAGLIIGYLFVGITVVAIGCMVLLASLGNNVKDVFKTINAQLNAAQAGNSTDDSSSTNSDSSTNAPDQTTPATTNSPDQSTNNATATPVTQ